MDEFIKVWEFHRAPQEYRDLSQNGGDEDYVMLIPSGWSAPWPDACLLQGTNFGCCEVESHELPTGETILIGCHS